MSKPLVSICCVAYNHEDYIIDAIESFLMQETDFPIEIIIHDDASMDRTTDILKEYEKKYPSLIKPIYQKENQHRQGNIPLWEYFLFPRVKGKYIALCDADDYWTDPLKLQKQVNLMERNNECTLCFHATKMIYGNNEEAGMVVHRLNNSKSTVFKGTDMIAGKINGWTASLLFRSDIAQNMPEWYRSIQYADVALKLVCAAQGNIGYIGGKPMSVYRRGTKGAWSSDEGKYRKWEEKRLENHLQLIDYFNKFTEFRFDKELKLKKSKHRINYLFAVQDYCSKSEAVKLVGKNLNLVFLKPKKFCWLCARFLFGKKGYKHFRNYAAKIRRY